jgi:hypothetical protein
VNEVETGEAVGEVVSGPGARRDLRTAGLRPERGRDVVVVLADWRRALGETPSEDHDLTLPELDMTDDSTGNGADGLGPGRRRNGAPLRFPSRHDEAVTMNEEKTMTALEYHHNAVDMLGEVPTDVLRRIARAHRRARHLLEEASLLVREQIELESSVGGRVVADDDLFYELRDATGLVALDSVLGNAAADISAPRGGLWCGGAPRPWPATGWRLDGEHPGTRRH